MMFYPFLNSTGNNIQACFYQHDLSFMTIMPKGNTTRKKAVITGIVDANILDYFFKPINSLLNLTFHFCFLLSIFLPLYTKGCHTVNGLRLYPVNLMRVMPP